MSKLAKLFIKNVTIFMDKNGVSKADIARSMGVASSGLAPYFRGDSAPSIDKLEKFAIAVKAEPHQLLMPEVPTETPTVSTLSKLVESQSQLLDGNEELLEAWASLDQNEKEVMLKQIQMMAGNKSKNLKSKA